VAAGAELVIVLAPLPPLPAERGPPSLLKSRKVWVCLFVLLRLFVVTARDLSLEVAFLY